MAAALFIGIFRTSKLNDIGRFSSRYTTFLKMSTPLPPLPVSKTTSSSDLGRLFFPHFSMMSFLSSFSLPVLLLLQHTCSSSCYDAIANTLLFLKAEAAAAIPISIDSSAAGSSSPFSLHCVLAFIIIM